jgi:hypothetical protein
LKKLLDIENEYNEHPLCLKYNKELCELRYTLGVFYLREMLEKMLRARQNNEMEKYWEIRTTVLSETNNDDIFVDALELSYIGGLEILTFSCGIMDITGDDFKKIVSTCRKFGIDEFAVGGGIYVDDLKQITDSGCKIAGVITIRPPKEVAAIKIKILSDGQ